MALSLTATEVSNLESLGAIPTEALSGSTESYLFLGLLTTDSLSETPYEPTRAIVTIERTLTDGVESWVIGESEERSISGLPVARKQNGLCEGTIRLKRGLWRMHRMVSPSTQL